MNFVGKAGGRGNKREKKKVGQKRNRPQVGGGRGVHMGKGKHFG